MKIKIVLALCMTSVISAAEVGVRVVIDGKKAVAIVQELVGLLVTMRQMPSNPVHNRAAYEEVVLVKIREHVAHPGIVAEDKDRLVTYLNQNGIVLQKEVGRRQG